MHRHRAAAKRRRDATSRHRAAAKRRRDATSQHRAAAKRRRDATSRLRALCGAALCLALHAGCSDDGGDDAGGAGATAADGGSGSGARGGGGAAGANAATALVGTFAVKLIEASDSTPAHTSFLGKLYDGPQPPLVPLVLESEVGDCRLLVPEVPFCDPDCGADACTADGECTPFPHAQSAGTVRVRGLGDAELELEPVGSSFTYMPVASLPHPPCAEGDAVRVEADAFALETPCIAPLVVPDTDPIAVRAGEPVSVAWTAGDEPSAHVRLVLDIAHHGGQKGEIDCEVADTGSFQIPGALVTELVGLGLAGFPTMLLARVSSNGTAPADQPDVTLSVSSEVERAVDTGVISCGIDGAECPDGMTCDDDMLVCVE